MGVYPWRQSFTWWGYAKQWVPKTGYPWSYDLSLLAIGSNSSGRKAHLFLVITFKGKLLHDFCSVDLLTTAVTK